uniref:Putative tnf receptor-associated factor ovary overexpressed n=1 Tax=Rhipicephalus microplus TaxID=6941 RepID=A0A6M2D453_RHIMP
MSATAVPALKLAQFSMMHSQHSWKLLRLVSCEPRNFCSLCGLLPAASFMLPCKHLLCGSCFYQSSQMGYHCPVDRRAFRQEEVVRMLIERDAILGLRIRCWNAGNGCAAEDAVSVMLDHFVIACKFHTVNCPTCDEKVLHRELPRHVMSRCAATCSLGKCDKSSPASSFHEGEEELEKASRMNAALHRNLATVQMRTIYEMKRTMDHISATLYRVKAEATQSKCTSCGSHMDSLICKIARIVTTNMNAFMTTLQRKSYHDVESLNDSAHEAVGDHTKNIASTAPTILKLPTSTCPRTTNVIPVQKTSAEEPNVPGRKLPVKNSQLSLLGSHETNLSNFQECCECIIENWASFSAGTAVADIRNGRCACGTAINAYGFLLVPRTCASGGKRRIYFTVCAFKGFFGTTHEVPMDSVLRIRLVGSATDRAKDLGVKEELSWSKTSSPQKIMGEEVLYFSTSKQSLITRAVEERGFVSDDKVQLRFSVTRW